jgi:hypothetical protein
MAKKKSKRPNLSQETLERARAELRGERTEVVTPVETVRTGGATIVAARPKQSKRTGANLATRRIPSLEELRTEYGYVTADLRNLAILAVILIAGIIAAAVVLPHPTG